MGSRVRIVDIVRETGLSRATVDRVMNSRAGVHPHTRALVEESVRALTDKAGATRFEMRPTDVILRLGSGQTRQIRGALERLDLEGSRVFDMYQRQEDDIVGQIQELCEDVARPLILCVKDTDQIRSALTEARKRGKTVVALISEQSAEARDAFVGIDNRAAGQTAAFLVGRTLGGGPAEVGVVVGDYAFRCHEEREIGFRSTLRARFPKLSLVADARGEDNPDQTYRAVLDMVTAHPGLAAIYNVSGGNAGLAQALAETDRAGEILVISHEATSVTVPLLRNGVHDYLISQDPDQLIGDAVRVAELATSRGQAESHLLDFSVFTPFNIPSYGLSTDHDPAPAFREGAKQH